MKANNLGYLMKEGIRGIFLHGFMSFAAVCVTVACLLIVGFFSCLTYNLNIMAEELNDTNKVLAYIDKTYTEDKARSVQTEINRLDNVYLAEFVTKEEAWEDFVQEQGGPEVFGGIGAEILEHRVQVTLKEPRLLEQSVEELKNIPGVVDVVAQAELAEGFSIVQDVIRIGSLLIIGVLLVVSLLIISNTVKLAMYDRKEEISIMKMVGATNGFIRLPFIVEGFMLGMLGAGLAFGLEWILYDVMVGRVAAIDTLKIIEFVPFTDPKLLWSMIGTFLFGGLFVGVLGSWASIRKFMDV